MAKRPLLSANMRMSAPAPARVPEPDGPPAAAEHPPQAPAPALTMPSAAADSVAGILTESGMVLATAAYLGWSQAFVLPLRLSTCWLAAGRWGPAVR